MQNLNDYYYFVQVVKYQGFTKASEALGITKSKLSRRISELETRLNVRLIQRNTRKFAVTEVGQQFYEFCLKIMDDVNSAENFIQSTFSDEPTGLVRISCPVALVGMPVGQMIADFMQHNMQVRVDLVATNRRVDLIEEGIDLAIRVRNTPLDDSDLIVRELDAWEHALVAHPDLFLDTTVPQHIEKLNHLPSIGFHAHKSFWTLHQCDEPHMVQEIEFQPRLKTDNFTAIKAAVLKGVGIASLPRVFVHEELKQGTLIELLPEWHLPKGVIYIVYTSRLGMLPAVRAVLEHLLAAFKDLNLEH